MPPLCARQYAQRASAPLFKQRSARPRQTLKWEESSSEPAPAPPLTPPTAPEVITPSPGFSKLQTEASWPDQTSTTRTVEACWTPAAY